MAKSNKKSGLGRGLSSLIGESLEEVSDAKEEHQDNETPVQEREVTNSLHDDDVPYAPYVEEDDHVEIRGVVERAPKQPDEVPLVQISPNPDQPRTQFKPEEIDELAASIEKDGLLQPIVVRAFGDGYQIIAGERRWQACRKLGLATVPVRILDASDEHAIELALIENVQRTDLNPIEEAYGYKCLIERRGMTQSQVAEVVSKGRSTIANALRLLDLPEEAQQMLYEERISAGHARAILSIPTAEGRARLTEKLASENLSVRDAENLARLYAGSSAPRAERTERAKAPDSWRRVAQGLREKLQTNVRVKTLRGKNRIEIEFKDEDELKRLFEQIAGE